MLGTTTMARRTRDRNIQIRHSLNRLDGTVHNDKNKHTKNHDSTKDNTKDTMTTRSSTFPIARVREIHR